MADNLIDGCSVERPGIPKAVFDDEVPLPWANLAGLLLVPPEELPEELP